MGRPFRAHPYCWVIDCPVNDNGGPGGWRQVDLCLYGVLVLLQLELHVLARDALRLVNQQAATLGLPTAVLLEA